MLFLQMKGWLSTSSSGILLNLSLIRSSKIVIQTLQFTENKILCLFGHVVPDDVVEWHWVVNGLSGRLLLVVAIEGEHATQKNVDDDP